MLAFLVQIFVGKEASKRGGWKRENLSRYALQSMYNSVVNVSILVQIFWTILVRISLKKRQKGAAGRGRKKPYMIIIFF